MRLPSGCTDGCAVVIAPLTLSLNLMGPRVVSVSRSSTNDPSASSVMLTAALPSCVGITFTCGAQVIDSQCLPLSIAVAGIRICRGCAKQVQSVKKRAPQLTTMHAAHPYAT